MTFSGKHNTVLAKNVNLFHIWLQDTPETVCLQLYRLISYNQSDPWLPPKHLMKWSDKVFCWHPAPHENIWKRWTCIENLALGYWGFVQKPRTDYETKGPEPLTHKKDHQPTIQDRDTQAQSHFQLLPRPLAFHMSLYPSGHFFGGGSFRHLWVQFAFISEMFCRDPYPLGLWASTQQIYSVVHLLLSQQDIQSVELYTSPLVIPLK